LSENDGGGLSNAVISGLAVGIALVITLSFIFNSSTQASEILGQHHVYVNISIQGLKSLYHIGESITFTEQITGYAVDCDAYPDINIEAVDRSQTIFTTYDRNGNGLISGCGDPDGNTPHMINVQIRSYEASPIRADKAGKYVLTATYAHGKVEKTFTVDNLVVPYVSNVIIPKGASLYGSPHVNFEPETIKVVISLNNTVRWVNSDSVPSSVIANNAASNSDFHNATKIGCENDDETNCTVLPGKNFLNPGETFEYTFTKAGEYGYHSAPHPWMHGTVIVVNETHN
jgi:plastocyanin